MLMIAVVIETKAAIPQIWSANSSFPHNQANLWVRGIVGSGVTSWLLPYPHYLAGTFPLMVDGNSAPLEPPYKAETSFVFVLPTRASLHSQQGFGLVLDFASGLLYHS
jgi:hypothetical protein